MSETTQRRASADPTQIVHIIDTEAASRRALHEMLAAHGIETALYETQREFLQCEAGAMHGCLVLSAAPNTEESLRGELELLISKVMLPVILISPGCGVDTAVQAMKLGAVDFLATPLEEDQVLAAIEGALALSLRRARSRAAAALIVRLSPREREVLDRLMSGGGTRDIAADMRLSMRTVELHRARMLRRLGVRNLPQAIELAVLADLKL